MKGTVTGTLKVVMKGILKDTLMGIVKDTFESNVERRRHNGWDATAGTQRLRPNVSSEAVLPTFVLVRISAQGAERPRLGPNDRIQSPEIGGPILRCQARTPYSKADW